MSNNLKSRIQEDMKDSMRTKQKDRLSTIRLLLAAIKQRELDNPIEQRHTGLQESDIIKVIEKMIKQRRESISQYERGNRSDLAEKEQREIEILESYLPEAISESEMDILIQQSIKETRADSIKHMGKVMSLLIKKLGDRRVDDMGMISVKIKRLLS